jgi:alpha-amylase
MKACTLLLLIGGGSLAAVAVADDGNTTKALEPQTEIVARPGSKDSVAVLGRERSQSNLFEALPPIQPDRGLCLKTKAHDWYKDAVVYHLWVAAFRDSDGDGVGDLKGVIQGLDALKDLGVTCLWLSPFVKSSSSPRNLHGYDVVDHYTVDPRLGTNDDAKTLVREAHARGMRLIFDFVPNHLSSKHPWFIEARDAKSPKRDWFVWRDTRPEKGWTGFDKSSDWHPANGAFYYAIFFSGMPDVNHRNADARLEMAKAARHWLDLGFDGLRMDAVRYLYENLAGDGAKSDQEDQPETLTWFESFRREVLDPYTSAGYAKFMVAENWTSDRRSLLSYMGREERPSFHMTLNFPLLAAFTKLNPTVARDLWTWDANLPPHAWLGAFTSNHDLAADRPGTLFAKDPAKLRAQAAWLLLGPGTPFVYYGNEIAQPQGPDRGDTKHRKPLDWASVDRQRDDPSSAWRWHQQLIRLRSQHASLRRGKAQFLPIDAGDNVLAIWRTQGDDITLTLFNAQDSPVESLKITLPARVTEGQFVLGSGAVMLAAPDTLDAGPFVPFETKVVRLRR